MALLYRHIYRVQYAAQHKVTVNITTPKPRPCPTFAHNAQRYRHITRYSFPLQFQIPRRLNLSHFTFHAPRDMYIPHVATFLCYYHKRVYDAESVQQPFCYIALYVEVK